MIIVKVTYELTAEEINEYTGCDMTEDEICEWYNKAENKATLSDAIITDLQCGGASVVGVSAKVF